MGYMTLTYGNGRGYTNNWDAATGLRVNPNNLQDQYYDNNFRYPATLPKDSESHAGEDVGLYANGPWSHLFTGVVEQNMIPHMMAFASCIGNGITACD
jgi:alkaline phosphatase